MSKLFLNFMKNFVCFPKNRIFAACFAAEIYRLKTRQCGVCQQLAEHGGA